MARQKIDDGLEGNYARRYYLRNKEKVLAKTRLRQQMHPELCREYTRKHRLKKYGPRVIKTILDRFMEKVEQVTETGCWIWMGTWQANGYGRVNYGDKKSGLAHRWSFMNFNGPIPEGMEIDHTCHVRCCVNPEHLRAVTHAENMACRQC